MSWEYRIFAPNLEFSENTAKNCGRQHEKGGISCPKKALPGRI
jgi:hypothetical protein